MISEMPMQLLTYQTEAPVASDVLMTIMTILTTLGENSWIRASGQSLRPKRS